MDIVKRNVWIIVLLMCACSKPPIGKKIPIDNFFKTQDRAFYRISPDGKSLAFLKLHNKKQDLFVEDLESGKVSQITQLNEKNIRFYFWVSNDELIYYKERPGKERQADIYIINKKGGGQRALSENSKARIRVLEDQLIDDKFLLVASNQRDSTIFDVYRLNVRNGQMDIAAKNPGNITDWMTDSKGMLRIAVASDGVNETFLYRENEQKPFRPVITNNFITTLQPIAFSETDPNTVYAISNVNRDKNALVEIDFASGKEKRVLFSNDTLNVMDAQYLKSKRKIGFVVCETWKKEKFYLDESVKRLYSKLDRLLPGTESRITDRDKSDNVFIVRTFTDRNPGSYYLYFAQEGRIKKLSDINSSIKEEEMSGMKPISYRSRDGLIINGYLTLPKGLKPQNLPTIVLPHNGPGSRNSWEYNADVQFLANRGYAVLQINYRGSKGYGKHFYAAGFKQWGGKIENDISDGVKWLIDRKIANPKKVAIYGTGLGGYIALNCLYTNPTLYACGGSNSGVINLFSYLKAIPPYLKAYLQMYYDVIGNPVADADYIRNVSPVFHAEKFKAPVFIAQTVNDPRVNVTEGVQFVKELQKRNVPVTYIEKEESSNTAQNEEERQKLYKALENFLSTNLNKK